MRFSMKETPCPLQVRAITMRGPGDRSPQAVQIAAEVVPVDLFGGQSEPAEFFGRQRQPGDFIDGCRSLAGRWRR